MKRLIVALLVGGAVFGTVYGVAATLNVGFGTAATGAPFNDTASDSGTITAGTVDITKLGSGTLNIEMEASNTDCETIIHGNDGDDSVTATNTQSTTVTTTAPT